LSLADITKEGELEILYGHPELNETLRSDSIKFQEAKAYNRNGVIVPISLKRENDGVTLLTVDKGGYNPNMQQSGGGSPTYFWQHRP
jgi:hypothetical protein